jgi:murein DD-endopeptidase MepM/ murein hydrolase activator NlpD
MRNSSAPSSRAVSKVSLLVSAAAAVMLSGCSSGLSRFSENVSDRDPVYTASVPRKQVADIEAPAEAAADEAISGRPLANAQAVKRPLYASNAYNGQKSGKTLQYRKPVYAAPHVAAAEPEIVDETVVPANSAATTLKPIRNGNVTVGQGMTLYSIAKANGVSVGDLASANNIEAPYSVKLGQALRIPGVPDAKAPVIASSLAAEEVASAAPNQLRYKKQAVAAQDDAVPAPKLSGGAHTVASGETLFSLGRKYGVSPFAIADLNGLPHATALRLGQNVKIPGGAQKTMASNDVQEQSPAPLLKKPAKAQDSIAQSDEPAAEEIPVPQKMAAAAPPANADPSLPGFRWPVRGKVISPYGVKSSGLRNEGVNIAVPEGTSVRAAESGVVAYAGNELKGYGNLVLVRHEGGWVTAYAHAKELFVKRGDTVKRGDVIAKAGQTGSVSSPQLHFEVRKGAAAMDPMKFLNAATASN